MCRTRALDSIVEVLRTRTTRGYRYHRNHLIRTLLATGGLTP